MTLTGTFPSTMSKVSISLRGMCFLRNCLYCLELSFSVACQVENAGGLKGSLRWLRLVGGSPWSRADGAYVICMQCRSRIEAYDNIGDEDEGRRRRRRTR